MSILIIDTALGACTALVAEGERIVAVRSEMMARGHQERLGGLVRDVLSQAGGPDAIDRVAVTVGPGSFTGLRVGLAFAKGFALALEKPVTGLGVLDALAESAGPGLAAAVIDARRDQVYLGLFRDGRALTPPAAVLVDDAVRGALGARSGLEPITLIGTGADLLADRLPDARRLPLAAPEPDALARLAARAGAAAEPLYLRPPDAKPPKARA